MSYIYPIIIAHKGNQDYLHICLKQAHFSNPNSRIILLGDESNKNCLPFVEWHNIYDYFDNAVEFEKRYIHLSCNPYDYEMFAIQKWFAIKDFIFSKNIEKALIMDSDVLVYSDFSKEDEWLNNFRDCDIATCGYGGQQTIFYNNKEIMQRFCDYIMKKYADKAFMDQIISDYNTKQKYTYKNWHLTNGPISDMTWITWFVMDEDMKWFNTFTPSNNSIINLALNKIIYYPSSGILMNIYFNNKIPYTILLETNTPIRLHTMHFQGWKKQLMQRFATYDKDDNWSDPQYTLDDLCTIYQLDLSHSLLKSKEKIFIEKFSKYITSLIPIKKWRVDLRNKIYKNLSEKIKIQVQ